MVNRIALTGLLVIGCLWCWARVINAHCESTTVRAEVQVEQVQSSRDTV